MCGRVYGRGREAIYDVFAEADVDPKFQDPKTSLLFVNITKCLIFFAVFGKHKYVHCIR